VQSKISDKIYALSKLCKKLFILTGNHDTPFQEEIEHSTIKLMKYMPNVEIIGEKPVKVNVEGINLGLTSWCNSAAKLAQNLENFKDCDYGFGHNSVYGFEYEGISVPEKGHLGIESFESFKAFFMGHIHKRQIKGNMRFIGSGLQCRAIEYKNLFNKIDILDLKSGKIEDFTNEISPKYVRLDLLKHMDTPIKSFNELIKNNFVNLIIPSHLDHLIDTSKFPKILSGYRSLNVKTKIQENLEIIEESKEKVEYSVSTSVEEYYKPYLDQLDNIIVQKQQIVVSNDDKIKMFDFLKQLHKDAQQNSKELQNN
jgi:DNA repair exonuclease SbcCD nuclease subunit